MISVYYFLEHSVHTLIELNIYKYFAINSIFVTLDSIYANYAVYIKGAF